jgi:glutathione reductase (NADPH)
VRCRAVIEDANTVRLPDRGMRVRAGHILIATGSTPTLGADIAGLHHVISSNEAFHLKELPKRILIQGGGYIAVEFAGIFNGLGSEVTLVYRGDAILRGFDDDVRAHLSTEMGKRGIRIITKRIVEAVERVDHGLCVELSDHEDIMVDKVMFATGRKPNVEGLWDPGTDVALEKHGGIAVDNFSQTSVASIYAIGDVTNRVNLTPVAIREGHAFADTVFGSKPTPVDHGNVPTAVFSEPEVGAVGLTEAEACAKLAKVDIYKTSFRPMKATLAGRDTRTFMKLVVDGTSDRLVGCHIVGPDAGEMIQLVGVALKMKATKAQFDEVIAVHPTAAEELVTMRDKALSHRREAAE